MADREAFEAKELHAGRPRSALYRTPAGAYEDEEVERAWQLWQSLRSTFGVPARRFSYTGTALVASRHGQPLREPPFIVRVMARAEGYAMVCRPGCAPFVLRESDLKPVELKKAATG